MNGADTTMKTAGFDWSHADAMTDRAVHAAAMKDPDARPMTDAEWAAAPEVPRARIIRRAGGLTQEEFAARFQIPLSTLRDWEQGKAEPDQSARAYLKASAPCRPGLTLAETFQIGRKRRTGGAASVGPDKTARSKPTAQSKPTREGENFHRLPLRPEPARALELRPAPLDPR